MDDPVVFVKKATDWLGADVCIDAVGCDATGSTLGNITGKQLLLQAGNPTALHWAINSVKKGGVVSVIGVYGPPWNLVPIGSVMNKGITLRGNQASVKRLLPKLIEHVMAGRLNPKGIISHRIPLENISDAYRMFSAKLDNMIKPLLIPPRAYQV
jgi:threonine dehydrogenase-like Zn-dependent dehydrogenase